MTKPNLTAQRLREVLHYDPETGVFTMLVRCGSRHPGPLKAKPKPRGTTQISIDGKSYQLHRLAFLYMTGEWPKNQIDHKFGNTSDAAMRELRDATPSENMQNRLKPRPDSKLGVIGVQCRRGKFIARITHGGKVHYLGAFLTIDAARAAYIKEKKRVHSGFIQHACY